MTRALLALSLLLGGCAVSEAAPTPAAQEATVSLYDLKLTALDGSDFDMAQLKGKAVLFVNVASKCGFTPQYEGLQALYESYKDKGLVIVGQPCNQFGSQEPGSSEEIASFCKMNFGVTFPLLDKADVNGKDRNSLYTWLIGSEAGGGKAIGWNFEKFLVSPKGEVVGRWGSRTKPDDAELRSKIDAVLAAK